MLCFARGEMICLYIAGLSSTVAFILPKSIESFVQKNFKMTIPDEVDIIVCGGGSCGYGSSCFETIQADA